MEPNDTKPEASNQPKNTPTWFWAAACAFLLLFGGGIAAIGWSFVNDERREQAVYDKNSRAEPPKSCDNGYGFRDEDC